MLDERRLPGWWPPLLRDSHGATGSLARAMHRPGSPAQLLEGITVRLLGVRNKRLNEATSVRAMTVVEAPGYGRR